MFSNSAGEPCPLGPANITLFYLVGDSLLNFCDRNEEQATTDCAGAITYGTPGFTTPLVALPYSCNPGRVRGASAARATLEYRRTSRYVWPGRMFSSARR